MAKHYHKPRLKLQGLMGTSLRAEDRGSIFKDHNFRWLEEKFNLSNQTLPPIVRWFMKDIEAHWDDTETDYDTRHYAIDSNLTTLWNLLGDLGYIDSFLGTDSASECSSLYSVRRLYNYRNGITST